MANNRHRPQRQRPAARDLQARMTGGSRGGRNRGQGDSYRPAPQQNGRAPSRSDFTFTSNTQGPRFPPAAPAELPPRPDRRRDRGGASGTDNMRPNLRGGDAMPSRGRGRHNHFRGGFRSQAAHERALLQTRDDNTEQFLGVTTKTNKFRDLADLSDEDEANMVDVVPKLARTQSSNRADANSVPKWSNPDPYTVLPPPEESTNKRSNVVEMIRKAKIQAAEQGNAGVNAVAANHDFISLNSDDQVSSQPQADATLQGSLNEVAAIGSIATANDRAKRVTQAAGLPARPNHTGINTKRKHTDDYHDSELLDAWRPRADLDPAPWADRTRYACSRHDPNQILHDEIADFYRFVRPDRAENEMRQKLIDDLRDVVGHSFQSQPGDLSAFGSFPVGLNLPTADMDLVFVSDSHFHGGRKVITAPSRNELTRLARRLRDSHVAENYLVIHKAKVPIIKFTDPKTRLPVDISFENMTGLTAQETLEKWKRRHTSHLTHLVALVKQFLAMRGLNDNSTGGLGGYSVICLVVNFLELNEVSPNFGDAFLHFLHYWGHFDYAQYRVAMNPPDIVRKGTVGIDGRNERDDRLSIQDPNNDANNISGGSYRAQDILHLFLKAHETLVRRMKTIHSSPMSQLSILEVILGGNYTSYYDHRALMRRLDADRFGPYNPIITDPYEKYDD